MSAAPHSCFDTFEYDQTCGLPGNPTYIEFESVEALEYPHSTCGKRRGWPE